MRAKLCAVLVGFAAAPAAALDKATCDSAADLDALVPGQWCELPGTHLDAPGVRPDPMPAGAEAVGVIAPWSGGAWDRKRDRLIVWGGGHMDYAGNEVYAFDLGTRRWLRLSDPARNTGGDEGSGYYPSNDGAQPVDPSQPRARHTYNYVQYVDSLDRFCSFGGAALYPSGQTGVAHVDCFDLDAHRWQPLGEATSEGIGAKSAYDCRTGHVWVQGTVSHYGLSELDPATNRWTVRVPSDEDLRYAYGHTADIDPAARRMIAVGQKEVLVWNLADPAKVTRTRPAVRGDVDVLARPAPGLAYDFHARTMVAWAGGTDVYTVEADAANAIVTRVPAAAANRVPASALAAYGNGTFGRWRYVPSKNVFIVVNATDRNVFLYRHVAGTGGPVDCQAGTAPPPVPPPDAGAGDVAQIDATVTGAGGAAGPDAGPSAGGAGESAGAGGGSGAGGRAGAGGVGGGAGAGDAAAGAGPRPDAQGAGAPAGASSGCGCRLARGRDAPGAIVLACAVLSLARLRARRRR